jgi:flagellar export protein FliJ
MKPFSFSLQAVRTLRRRQEQQAVEAFGQAVRARQAALDQQTLAERQLSAALDHMLALQQEGAAIYHLNQMRAHCQTLERHLGTCRAALAKAQETANQVWDALQEARRQLELVDKLYLHRREDYERELRTEEQKLLDEMSGRRWLLGNFTAAPTALAWN